MPMISVDQAAPGMVLAGPITDRRGRLLIPAGKSLTDKHMNALRMWGIAQLEIEGDEPEDATPSAVEPALLAQAEEDLKPFFSHADLSHPFMQKFFDYCALRRARKIHQDEAAAAPAREPAHVG